MNYATLSHTQFLGNPVTAWIYALVGALVGWLIVSSLLSFATSRLTAQQQRPQTPGRRESLDTIVGLLQSTKRWLVLLLALTLALDTLRLPGHAKLLGNTEHGAVVLGTPNTLLPHIAFAICAVQVAFWCVTLVNVWIEKRISGDKPGTSNVVLVGMLSWFLKLVVWVVLILAILGNAGMNITAFIASLGVGGIAIALGLQTVLKDVFASIAIGLDKPYKVGEFIMFGDTLGTVVKVGARSVRIASLSGEELSISNSELLARLVHNYSRMPERRIVFGFRVPYDTTREQVQKIVEKTRGFLQAETQVRFDRGHFIAFGEYGFDFQFVYYVLNSDFALYRDIQQRVNLQIMALLEEMNVRFAVPIRKLEVNGQGLAAGSGMDLGAAGPAPADPA